MRKKFTLLMSCALLTLTAVAQTNGNGGVFNQRPTSQQTNQQQSKPIGVPTKSNGYELSVGPRIGLGLAMGSDANGSDFADGAGFGWDAGLGVNIRFGGKDSKGRPLNGRGIFGLGIELNWSGYSIQTVAEKNLNLGYFEVPVLFQFYPGYQTKQLKNFYIEVGPTFAALGSKSPESLQVDDFTIYKTGGLKGGDVKGTIGLGYRLGTNANSGMYLNLRYNQGFSNLAGNLPTKVSSFELTFGYLFKCSGGVRKGNATTKTSPKHNVLY